MKNTKRRKRKKLSRRLLLGLVIYALISLICISVVVGFYYFSVEVVESSDNAFALARSGALMVDGDRVLDYLKVTGTDDNGNAVYYTDEYYYEVMDILNNFQSENDLVLYYYICVPREENIIYIWDATTAQESSPQGYVEDYFSDMDKENINLAFSREPAENITTIVDPDHWGYLLSAYSPIYNSSGDPVALVGVDLSLEDMVGRFVVYLELILITILIVTVISILFLYRVVKRIVVKPIQKLNEATKSIMGELSGSARFDLQIHTRDEMEELADSFRKMDDDIHEYLEQLTTVTADKERIHAELNIAKQIQTGILPNSFPAFPDRNDFDIYAALFPGEKIGGNFFDFFLIDSDHLAMLVGDVAGDGVPAALYMVIVATLIKDRAAQGFTPAEVLQSVSEQMLSNNMDLFSFVWFAVLELSTGKGIAVNAGHDHPILRRAGKKFELLEYRHDPPVGAAEGVRFRDHGFQLQPGDSLFIYSDGIRESSNEKSELFGRQRILEALNREPDATPSVLIQTVKQSIDRFTGNQRQADDLTMLSLKYYGPAGESDRI